MAITGPLVAAPPATPDGVRDLVDDTTNRGHNAIWFQDGVLEGTGCGFVHATWASAVSSDLQVGVWATPGHDHPVRFAEEFAVVDRLSGGRAMMGISGTADHSTADWIRAVNACWEQEVLELDSFFRLPARDPANCWVPAGWTMQVTPRPVNRPVVWWFDSRGARPPGEVVARPCRIVTTSDGQVVEADQ